MRQNASRTVAGRIAIRFHSKAVEAPKEDAMARLRRMEFDSWGLLAVAIEGDLDFVVLNTDEPAVQPFAAKKPEGWMSVRG